MPRSSYLGKRPEISLNRMNSRWLLKTFHDKSSNLLYINFCNIRGHLIPYLWNTNFSPPSFTFSSLRIWSLKLPTRVLILFPPASSILSLDLEVAVVVMYVYNDITCSWIFGDFHNFAKTYRHSLTISVMHIFFSYSVLSFQCCLLSHRSKVLLALAVPLLNGKIWVYYSNFPYSPTFLFLMNSKCQKSYQLHLLSWYLIFI